MTNAVGNPQLVSTLAQATAQMLHWSKDPEGRAPGDGVAGEFLWHGAQLDLEIAAEVLLALGIAALAPGESAIYQLTCNVADIDAHLGPLENAPPLDRIISAFIGIANLRGAIDVSRHAIFSTPAHVQHAMEALTSAGYAARAGDLFRWRETIRPAMRIQHLWPEA
jgi:hypothetical protein